MSAPVAWEGGSQWKFTEAQPGLRHSQLWGMSSQRSGRVVPIAQRLLVPGDSVLIQKVCDTGFGHHSAGWMLVGREDREGDSFPQGRLLGWG